MIKKLYRSILFFIAILMVLQLNAQNRTVTILEGTVSDSLGNPINDVRVSTNTGEVTKTDENGLFEVSTKNLNHIVFEKDYYATRYLKFEEGQTNLELTLDANELFMGKEDMVNIPFGKLEKRRLVGSVTALDVQEQLDEDQRINIGAATNGKLGGVFYNSNVLGFGSATYVIDGIPRDPSFINLTEVEEITVLKDPVSRVLYGSAADNGVILVTTKRGFPHKRKLSVRADYGILTPRELPEYLGAADYMQAINQAYLNDGRTPLYSSTQIQNTRSGIDPIRYPDESYYNSTFMKDAINYLDVNLESSGGNDVATYFLNLGFNNTEGWLNQGEGDISNRVNVRGNTDYKLSDRLRANLDAIAVFDFFASPDVFDVNAQGVVTGDFWTAAQTSLPNATPLLIPISRIGDPSSFSNANLVNGQFLLGGSNEFPNNIYGDLLQNGRKNINSRYLQLNTGLDWDLGFILEGLTATADLTFDFFNTTVENQLTNYAVYQPIFSNTNPGDIVSVNRIGADLLSNEREVLANEAFFRRRFGTYGTLNYKKDWNKNKLDVTALLYIDQTSLPDQYVDNKAFNYGLRANYIHDNKYVAEFGGLFVGTRKLPVDENFAFSPTFGVGWVMSEEEFFSKEGIFDYFKVRATIGLLHNDNWQNNFLYETSYSRGPYFNYSNTVGNNGIRNAELNLENIATLIDWQKRSEFNVGFDALLFERSLSIDASYFRSRSFDIVTNLNNSVPDLLGYDITTNNNAYINSGIESTIRYNTDISEDWKLKFSTGIIYATSKVDELDEPFYANDAQQRVRVGNRADAIFGLTADGLYGPSDFNTDGTLLSSLPQNTFGSVQPGDIKYVDINGDGIIDDDDQSQIGNAMPDLQYSISMNISFKNFEFFLLGIGQSGETNIRNGNYFWTSGNDKYPVHALEAYGPENLDTNSSIPRLSSIENSNNYRNSNFWTYENNSFTIPAMQLAYNYRPTNTAGLIKSMKVFVKGTNLIIINKNKELSELQFGVGSSPLTKGISFGLLTSF